MEKTAASSQFAPALLTNLKTGISQIFAETLWVPIEELDADEELEYYGLNSYAIVNIMVELAKVFPDLPSTLLFEHRTIQSIVNYLEKHYRDSLVSQNTVKKVTPGISREGESNELKETVKTTENCPRI